MDVLIIVLLSIAVFSLLIIAIMLFAIWRAILGMSGGIFKNIKLLDVLSNLLKRFAENQVKLISVERKLIDVNNKNNEFLNKLENTIRG